MITLNDIQEGSIVLVNGGFGREPAAIGIVDSVEKDIKNGMPGISYIEEGTRKPRWAYLDQVVQVISFDPSKSDEESLAVSAETPFQDADAVIKRIKSHL